MNRIKARLADTSESWIASIVLVLNLIKLIGRVPLSLLIKLYEKYIAIEDYTFLILKSQKISGFFFAET